MTEPCGCVAHSLGHTVLAVLAVGFALAGNACHHAARYLAGRVFTQPDVLEHPDLLRLDCELRRIAREHGEAI